MGTATDGKSGYNANMLIAIGTIVIALVNGALLGYYIIQVNALQDQVTISKQQFESMTRPWVGIKDIHFHKIACISKEPFVKPLTREQMDNFGPGSAYQSINQYVFRNKCSALDMVFDVVVRNYGSVPAKSIRMAYMSTDTRAPDWDGSDFSQFELMVHSMSQYKTLTLMPQQETTIQLSQNATLENFPFLDVTDQFGAIPDSFLIGLQYEYGQNKSDIIGIVYKTSETSELRIVNSWNPRF